MILQIMNGDMQLKYVLNKKKIERLAPGVLSGGLISYFSKKL